MADTLKQQYQVEGIVKENKFAVALACLQVNIFGTTPKINCASSWSVIGDKWKSDMCMYVQTICKCLLGFRLSVFKLWSEIFAAR